MSAYPYRVSKERCIRKCEVELPAFLGGGVDGAYPVMGGAMVGHSLADTV